MKRSWIFLFLLLSPALLFLLLFPLWAGRSSLDTLTFPEVAAEDIRLMELSARWEEEEYRIEDAAFFEEMLSLFREIELRPLLLPPEKYPIEKAGAYWFYAELEDGRQCVFKLMGGKLLLNIVCGESPSRQHYAITKGEERLPEILALLEEYSREAESRYSITEPYAYPILPGSREWAEMDSMEERHAACQIPEEMLENMSTEALVDSIFEHPFLTNVMNENHEGYVVELERIEVFNGVQTLYQREDGIREMELKIQRIEEAIAEDSIELGKFKLLIAEAFLEKLQAIEAGKDPSQESRSPLLQEKLTAGLASADAVERYAWERVQQQLSYLEKISPELQFLDAGIELEKTDSFTEFYPDREIEAWRFSSHIQSDPVPQPDTGLPALDEAGWLSNDIGLGPCWLIVENVGGERSVLGHCYPEGEDIGLPSCITASLIHRDLEAGLDVSALLLRDLAYSIRYDPIPNAPGFLFRVPEKCPNAESDLRIRVFGRKDGAERELSGEIFGVSDSLSRWKAGNSYRFPCVVEEYDGLHMELSLPGVDGQGKAVELRIDLLSLAAENSPEQP